MSTSPYNFSASKLFTVMFKVFPQKTNKQTTITNHHKQNKQTKTTTAPPQKNKKKSLHLLAKTGIFLNSFGEIKLVSR